MNKTSSRVDTHNIIRLLADKFIYLPAPMYMLNVPPIKGANASMYVVYDVLLRMNMA